MPILDAFTKCESNQQAKDMYQHVEEFFPNTWQTTFGREALHNALEHSAWKGNMSMLRCLIFDLKLDVTYCSEKYPEGPLVAVCGIRQKEAALLLIEAGADINVEDRDGVTPFQWAVALDMLAVVNHLVLQKQVNFSPIFTGDCQSYICLAAHKGRVEILEFLVEQVGRGMIDNPCSCPDSLLPLVLARGMVTEVATWLVEEWQADAMVRSSASINFSGTTLHRAAANGKAQFCHILIYDGEVPVDVMDDCNRTPLHLACFGTDEGGVTEEARLAVVKVLLEAGADRKYISAEGKTARDYARIRGFHRVVDYSAMDERQAVSE